MNKTIQETKKFLEEFSHILPKPTAEVWIAPPFTAISAAADYVREKKLSITIGSQDVADQQSGAFTGEVSSAMLQEAGALFCIIGHSERRTLYHENDALIHAKIKMAIAQGLRPLLCVGESEKEREQGRVEEILHLQLAAALQGVAPAQLSQLCIAYEPVWAIGTGKAATPELAQEAHAICRDFLTHLGVSKVPLLYGGSVKPDNTAALMQQPDIDGALIGGAALDPKVFAQLITSVSA